MNRPIQFGMSIVLAFSLVQASSEQVAVAIPISQGDVLKFDFSTAGDGDGGSLADWNQFGGVGTIPAGSVIRHGDGASIDGVSASLGVTGAQGFNNDGNSAGWPGTAGDPFYIGATDDLVFANGTIDVTLSGLDDGRTYDIRAYSLIPQPGRIIDVQVTDGAGPVRFNDNLDRNVLWNTVPLSTDLRFDGVATNGSGGISVTLDADGDFFVLNALTIEAGAPAPPPVPLPLYSVDIQAVGGIIARPVPGTFSGVEPNYGFGDVWNAFNVNGHTGTTTNQTLNLVDSNGDPTPVDFTVIDTVSGWSNNSAEVLVNDYLFVGVGNADDSSLWEITGLIPGGTYEMYAYGGVARNALITVDTDGDGDLSDETPTLVNAAGHLFAGLSPDATGRILGEVAVGTAGNGEGNWAGFQLRATDLPAVVPEPASASLVLLGLGAAMMRSRRRRTR